MSGLAIPVLAQYALGGILLILVAATGIAALLRRARPERDYAELGARIRSWWIMFAVFAVAMALSRTVSIVFFAIVSFLALKEYFSLIPSRRADRRALFWAYLTIPVQFYWVAVGWYGMFIIFIPVYGFLFIALRLVIAGETRDFLRSVATIQWGLMLMVFSLSHVAYLLALPDDVSPAGSAGLVLFLVFLTQFNDVAQYAWGKLLGKRRVVPAVSPNKTLEGLAGGVVTTTLLAWLLAPWLTPLTDPQALLGGLLIALSGFCGDVNISALKRDLEVKDSGQLIPGHGGILDRVDSLTYTAPLFFHFVAYLHY